MEKLKTLKGNKFVDMINELEKKENTGVPVKLLLIMLSLIANNSNSDEEIKRLIDNLHIDDVEDAVRKILMFVSNTMLYNLYDYVSNMDNPEYPDLLN
jgi:hypothetical protein